MHTEPLLSPVKNKSHRITPAHIARGLTYLQYRQLVKELASRNKTTGPDQSERLVGFTRLNDHRMDRIDKTVKLIPELTHVLKSCQKPLYWVVLVEGWCGDGAQNLPVIARMAETSACIELRILLRDDNLDIMDAHLTNGSRSIPKLICLEKSTLKEIGEWGPRPAPVQEKAAEFKRGTSAARDKDELEKNIHLWYAGDRGLTIQHEFMQLLSEWGA